MSRAEERWAFRVTPYTDRLVRSAAAAADSSLTDFVVDAAIVEAERVLADRTTFTLAADDWERFVELLDRPPRDNPGLADLFSRPSVFADE